MPRETRRPAACLRGSACHHDIGDSEGCDPGPGLRKRCSETTGRIHPAGEMFSPISAAGDLEIQTGRVEERIDGNRIGSGLFLLDGRLVGVGQAGKVDQLTNGVHVRTPARYRSRHLVT